MGIHAVVGCDYRHTNYAGCMKFLRLPLVPLAALGVLIVRMLGKVGVNIRFGGFVSNRLGHLCGNTNVYLSERAAGLHPNLHLWTHYGPICNTQMAKMIARVMPVDPTRFTVLMVLINKMFKGWQKHDTCSITWDRDPQNLNEKFPPHFSFTEAEEARGRHDTASLGIPLGHKWVCLIVRDAVYLPSLSYHSYRNSDIDTYADAALLLARLGYYVVRMGAKVEKPFSAKHPRIIDYATSDKRSDFLDIYLAAKCAFCITTSTGLDAVCEAFKRPMCFVNFAPLEHLRTYIPNSLAIWKHYLKATLVPVKGRLVNGAWEAYTDTGKEISHGGVAWLADDDLTEHDWKRMSIAEIAASGAGKFMRADEFTLAGIKLQDNTSQEIVDVVQEMAELVGGVSLPNHQEQFWEDFPRSLDSTYGYPLHGEIRMRIGSKFLRSYDAERKEDIGSDTGEGRVKARTVQEHHALSRKATDSVDDGTGGSVEVS